MAVTTTVTSANFTGTGVSSSYAPGFYVNSSDQVQVYVDGVLKTLGVDYVVNGVGASAGCTIVGTFAGGSAVYIERVTPITQLVDTQNNETILEDVLDAEFDKLTMIAQELGGKTDRAVLVPKGEAGFTLPAAAQRVGYAGWAAGALVAVSLPTTLTGASVTTAVVNTRAALAALTAPVVGTIAFLSEEGRQGLFRCKAGEPPADTQQGIYVDSVTASHYWERLRDPCFAMPEWFGAVINDSGTDSYAALQGCLDVTGLLILGKGTYYSSRGLHLPDNSVVRGYGALLSGITVAHAADHLMYQNGVAGVSYAGGADLEGFALGRTPTPTTPASAANDITQGHGLHFFMVSNQRVRHVYTYNNLVECYVGNCLSPDIHDIRGLRQTGGAGDRWYGLYVDGVTAGGTFGGPSPNPSTTITKPNMIALAAVGQSYNYYLNGALQDLWIVDPEAAAGHKQFFLNINGATAGDMHIVRPIADGYKTNGFHVLGAPLGSSINIVDAWVAPAAGASGSGIKIDASHGVNLSGRGDFASASGLRCVDANDCTELDCNFRTVDSQNPFYGINVQSSTIVIKAHKRFAGGGGTFGEIITLISGSRNTARAHGTISTAGSPQLWNAGVALDATASNCTIDVTGVANGAATARYTVSAAAVTTQGNVSGHVVINPGAGAML